MITILIVLLVLGFFTTPIMPYSRDWGYYPSGGFGILAAIVLLLLLLHVV